MRSDDDGAVDVGNLVTGANRDDDAGTDAGSLVALLLKRDGSLKAARKFTGGNEVFPLTLPEGGRFGRSLGVVGDLADNGALCLAVGGGAGITGSIYNLFLNRAALGAATLDSADQVVSPAIPAKVSDEQPSQEKTKRFQNRPQRNQGFPRKQRNHPPSRQ